MCRYISKLLTILQIFPMCEWFTQQDYMYIKGVTQESLHKDVTQLMVP